MSFPHSIGVLTLFICGYQAHFASLIMALTFRVPNVSAFLLKSSPSLAYPYPKRTKMSLIVRSNASLSASAGSTSRRLPILLFDIMDTLVRDPFYHDVPAFFGMSLKELIECKHPTAWIEFEKGMIDEVELSRIFFKDGRSFDLEEILFCRYEMIEDKLKVSRYLSWTFCSCINGKRKPDPDFYLDVLSQLEVNSENCIFIDDRLKNVEAAAEVGIVSLHFKNTNLLLQDLSSMGIDFSVEENHRQY
ncbi:flavin mononucleotide hydrolase 1, chloroplatic isoform X3 [Carya illinoinensis]|uniref:flavin mononucleotide hydrolase 1, chloroplatic isoform X3 n=1 Tax=Carya illinoinensis TaxID=32201 RepID=UPI001C71C8D7|nr:flavin mononucleotide hydrolase 1, chloroplatic isoform X3 [Carya illinoinensis]